MTTSGRADVSPEVTEAEESAMLRALEIAQTPGVPFGPNPRVGCVLLDNAGVPIAEGYHRGAGTPHAEVDALQRAGDRAPGATAVVTLEPCNHTGRTGPCSTALVDAGVRRVVFAQHDPNPTAAGGASSLEAAGVDVVGGILEEEARQVNRVWTFAMDQGRPFVTWKYAATLDGRIAAADGTSKWITSSAARQDAHRLRSLVDVVLVGTGTVAADDPQLTAREPDGTPLAVQPLRAVMGHSEVAADRLVLDDAAPSVVLATRDPAEALAQLYARDRQHVLLEGGPTLAAAFLRAGLVDEVIAYLAPTLLGAGPAAIGDLGISSIGAALRLDLTEVTTVGVGAETCVRITAVPRKE